MNPGVDTEGDNLPEQINQKETPQPLRRSTHHEAPVHRLEPTMRDKTYKTNHLDTQNIESS